jgi:thiol-disulfide isomerase/thioredoxin
MNPRAIWAATAVAAGVALWLLARAPEGDVAADITPSAIFAATFADPAGNRQSLGQFEGKVVVINFWATWCAPCREEMPAFSRAERRWGPRGVQFVGLANEDPRRVARFGKDIGVSYPLWVGGEEIGEFSRRLGNRLGAVPYTVILDASGTPKRAKVGAYSERELDQALEKMVAERLKS